MPLTFRPGIAVGQRREAQLGVCGEQQLPGGAGLRGTQRFLPSSGRVELTPCNQLVLQSAGQLGGGAVTPCVLIPRKTSTRSCVTVASGAAGKAGMHG